MDLSKVTRFEVIDHSRNAQASLGDNVVRWLGVSAELSLQDEGRTLKVFLADSPVSAYDVRMAIQRGLGEFALAEDLPQVPGLLQEDIPVQLREP